MTQTDASLAAVDRGAAPAGGIDRGAAPAGGGDPAPPEPPVPGEVRLRARLARRLTQRTIVRPELAQLLRSVRRFHPKSEFTTVEAAFEVAERCHEGASRLSGEPYLVHPLAVAQILADLGMPPLVLAAALLHDTVEDTGYSLVELTADFGPEIAGLVDGVTKLDRLSYGDSTDAETVRKMIVAMARDIRVLLIKLADRLHNMRTLAALPEHKQARKASETLEIYAPLAHRLGVNTLKWELEDLAFATLYPKVYEELVALVSERAPQREIQLAGVIDVMNADFRTSKIKAQVTGRPKHYYSIYQKMIVRGREFDEIYDLVGVRVLVDSVRDCYAVLGVIHARWQPVPGRFKDYIAMPKFTMYRSLHTTVIGPGGKTIEIQIRTQEMHREAEYGVASHWRYKQDSVSGKRSPDDFGWVRQLLDWQQEAGDPGEFLESLRFDLASSEVFVFTPRGDVIALPSGSTTIDFAYAVHTEVGHRCVGARVNGRLVSLDTALDSGDVVEVFTAKSEDAGPSRDWLTFAASPRARTKIRAWFTKERREENVDSGREAIATLLRKQGLPLQRLMAPSTMRGLAEDLRFRDLSALYAAVGEGALAPRTVVDRLLRLHGGEAGATEDLAEAVVPTRAARRPAAPTTTVSVAGDDGVAVSLARCCTPVPWDAIFGYVTRGKGVSVHRVDCANASDLRQEEGRVIEVSWRTGETGVYLVNIQVEAIDRAGLLSDVTRVLAEQHVNILSGTVSTSRERIAYSRFTFEMGDPRHLGSVLRAVRGVTGVFDVYRV